MLTIRIFLRWAFRAASCLSAYPWGCILTLQGGIDYLFERRVNHTIAWLHCFVKCLKLYKLCDYLDQQQPKVSFVKQLKDALSRTVYISLYWLNIWDLCYELWTFSCYWLHFEETLKKNKVVFVDFWLIGADPAVHWLRQSLIAKEYSGKALIGKLDVDENPATAERFQVFSIQLWLSSRRQGNGAPCWIMC